MTRAKDISKIVSDADFGGTLDVVGKITADAGVDIDNINIDGTTIALSSGDLTLDVAGDIVLDADGGDVIIKDGGTTVGKIGVANTDQLFIGTPDGSEMGLRFDGDNLHILPSNASGAKKDGLADFGSASARWKDLYLSGGVVFDAVSGNATSNTLDDYEEGTWTPTLTGASSGTRAMDSGVKAVYTKVGNLVTAHMVAGIGGLTGSASGGARLGGLPFNYNGSNNEIMGKVHVTDVDLPSGIIECTLLSASSGTTNVCFFVNMFDNANHGELGLSAFDGDSSLRIVVTYHAA